MGKRWHWHKINMFYNMVFIIAFSLSLSLSLSLSPSPRLRFYVVMKFYVSNFNVRFLRLTLNYSLISDFKLHKSFTYNLKMYPICYTNCLCLCRFDLETIQMIDRYFKLNMYSMAGDLHYKRMGNWNPELKLSLVILYLSTTLKIPKATVKSQYRFCLPGILILGIWGYLQIWYYAISQIQEILKKF
jgi:hypothetical protein